MFPVLRYFVQFRPPDRLLLNLEKRALQHPVGGPWRAIPSVYVKRLDMMGLPSVPSLSGARLADGLRLIATTPAVWESHEHRPVPEFGDDTSVAPRRRRPADCTFLWDEVRQQQADESALLEAHLAGPSALARAARSAASERSAVDWASLLAARMPRLHPALSEDVPARATRELKRRARAAAGPTMNVLRTLCNG